MPMRWSLPLALSLTLAACASAPNDPSLPGAPPAPVAAEPAARP